MSCHMIMKDKKQSIGELRIDKVFSIHDHYHHRDSKQCRKQIDVDASADPKVTKPMPALALPDNLANTTIARNSCSDLVTKFDWTWDQSLERVMPDHVATRIMDLKNSTLANATDDAKFQTAYAFFIRQECNADQPIK